MRSRFCAIGYVAVTFFVVPLLAILATRDFDYEPPVPETLQQQATALPRGDALHRYRLALLVGVRNVDRRRRSRRRRVAAIFDRRAAPIVVVRRGVGAPQVGVHKHCSAENTEECVVEIHGTLRGWLKETRTGNIQGWGRLTRRRILRM